MPDDVDTMEAAPDAVMAELRSDFRMYLLAGLTAESTVDLYLRHLGYLTAWQRLTGRPVDPVDTTKADLQEYFAQLAARRTRRNGKEGAQVKKTYVAAQYRSIQQFWGWLESESVIDVNPFDKMKPPNPPDPLIPVMPDNAVTDILGTCTTRSHIDLRDKAIIRLFLDTGVRVSGLAGITLDDFDWDADTVLVTLKGGGQVLLKFGAKASAALRAYRRQRAKHPQAKTTTAFWLGEKGGLTSSGIRQMLYRRAAEAKLDVKGNPHLWRHLFCHNWLANGGSEQDLKEIMGWKSTKMAGRYGQSAAAARARQSHARMGVGDRY